MLKEAIIFLLISSIAIVLCIAAIREHNDADRIQYVATTTSDVGVFRQAEAIPILDQTEARDTMRSNPSIVLLDVRTPGEYAERHIPNSMLIPLEDMNQFKSAVQSAIPNRHTVVYLYCHSGGRSGTATKMMQDLGYTNVHNIGGLISWPYEIVMKSQ